MWIKDSYTKQLEGDLDHQRDSINDLHNQRSSLIAHQNLLVQRIVALKEVLAKKDAEILGWMHTNAAFKKLTKDDAARLGITNEERHADVDQSRIDIAVDESQRFNALRSIKMHRLVSRNVSPRQLLDS